MAYESGLLRGGTSVAETPPDSSESIRIPPHLLLPGPAIPVSVFVHDHHALGHIEIAMNLEVQRRELCAQHASQAQQSWSPEPDPRVEYWRCASAGSKNISERIDSVCF
jgi:hypothetical protein